jgi:type 1 glutamine amidotransferase
MKTRLRRLAAHLVCLAVMASTCLCLLGKTFAADTPEKQILIVAGPCEHPPGTHEAAAGARLLKHCLEHADNISTVRAEVINEWPEDIQVLEAAATIVFIGDIFPPERMDNPAKIKAELGAQIDRGCGIVCLHYATGLRAGHVADDGDHPLLKWMGGYFATGCKHHRSVARVCTATLVPETPQHPISRGWRKFTFDDEPYWNNYFGKDGPTPNVTVLASAMLPPEEPRKETVAWATERTDGGRGVGIVVPHYFRSWQLDDLRTLVLNSICWTAKIDIPVDGVRSSLPNLSVFQPQSGEKE